MSLDNFSVDLTNVTERGVLIAPSVQRVEVGEWEVKEKADTGNVVFYIPVTILGGDYDKMKVTYYHTVTSHQMSSAEWLKLLASVGILKDEDRGKDGKGSLITSIKLGTPVEGTDKFKVAAIKVNGQERKTGGRKAFAVISNKPTQDDPDVKMNWVESIKAVDTPSASGTSTAPSNNKTW